MTITNQFSPEFITREEFYEHLFQNTIIQNDFDIEDKLQNIMHLSDEKTGIDHIIFYTRKNNGRSELLGIARYSNGDYRYILYIPVNKENSD